jgi:hypothetical protein
MDKVSWAALRFSLKPFLTASNTRFSPIIYLFIYLFI